MSALRRAGLEVIGALGPGADGIRWAVRDAAGDRWAATVLQRPLGGERVRVRNRVARLAALSHPHLVRVGPVIELSGGGLVVLQQEVRGADLRTVRAGRGDWSAGEVVTVVVPLAEALAVLHAAGLAHGDVAPGNVVIDADGRPVLVDVVCSDGPTERGTPGFAAPERTEGAGPSGDVFALGRLGLWLCGDGADDAADDPSARRLCECLEAATAAEQRDRPGAAELARDVYDACPAEPVRLPEPAVLTQLALRRLAGGDDQLTERAPARPRARHRRGGRRPARLVVGAALGALACTAAVGVARGGFASDPSAAADERTTPGVVAPVVPLGTDPAAAAVRLTVARARALAAGDVAGLARATVPGSPAAVADQGAPQRRTEDEVAVVVHRVARLPGGCPPVRGGQPSSARCARVLLAAQVTAGGGAPPDVRSVVLVLRPTRDGWRVSEVEPAAP